MAEVAVWDRKLVISEIQTIAKHSPIFVPRGLQFYAPLIRGLGERIQGNTLSVGSGTTVIDHPKVIYPAGILNAPPPQPSLLSTLTLDADGTIDASIENDTSDTPVFDHGNDTPDGVSSDYIHNTSISLATLTLDADGTITASIENNDDSTPVFDHGNDAPDGLSSDYIQNDNSETTGEGWFRLTDVDADFDLMISLNIDVDVQAVGFSDDTCLLTARIFAADNDTNDPLTDETGNLGTHADSTRVQRNVVFAGLAGTKAQWNAAFIRFTWTYTKETGPDNANLRLFGCDIDGTYRPSSVREGWFRLTDVNADFSSMNSLNIDVDVHAVGFSDDTCTLTCRIFAADNDTNDPLTDETGNLGTEADTNRVQRNIAFSGLTGTETQWNAAYIRFTWTYSQVSGPDDANLRLFGCNIDGIYTPDAPVSSFVFDQRRMRFSTLTTL